MPHRPQLPLLLFLILSLHAPLSHSQTFHQEGIASYYGKKFHGRMTASGQRFDNNAFTCAHRTLPFGTRLRVTNLKNGLSVIVRVTDRGPFGPGRVVDLTYAAAQQIGIIAAGLGYVSVEVVGEDVDEWIAHEGDPLHALSDSTAYASSFRYAPLVPFDTLYLPPALPATQPERKRWWRIF